MIVKMKFLSISGPRTDIDRVSASFQIRNAAGKCDHRIENDR
mgnify:CR=1 FL=1